MITMISWGFAPGWHVTRLWRCGDRLGSFAEDPYRANGPEAYQHGAAPHVLGE